MATPRTNAFSLLTRSLRIQTRHLTTSSLLRQRFLQSTQPLANRPIGPQIHSIRRSDPAQWQIRRNNSSTTNPSKLYTFEEITTLSSSPEPTQILIDVREPAEYSAGYIPTAINIPVKSQPDALMLAEEEFEDRFGFPKPDQGAEVVFYCRSGVRSAAAAELAKRGGYAKVGEYKGSWVDWEGNGGLVEKP